MSLADLASLLGLIQGLILGAIILQAHRPDRPTGLLGGFILTLTLRILPILLFRLPFGATHPWVVWLPFYCWYTSLPLLYLYTKQLTTRLNWKRDWIHLAPGALEIGFFSVLLVWDLVQAGPLFTAEVTRGIIGVHTIAAVGPAILYGFYIIQHINANRDNVLRYYSNLSGKRLRWLKIAIVFLVGFAMVYTLLRYGPFPVSPTTIALFGAVANTVAIYYVTVNGLRQFALFVRPGAAPLPEASADEPDADQSPPPELYSKVENTVRQQRLYLDPQLTIATLSDELSVSERNLSRIINSGSGLHFNGYINRYRVAEAKRLLRDTNFDHYTMEGIAAEAGFNTKATFYQAFKLHSDISPAVFRRRRRSLPAEVD